MPMMLASYTLHDFVPSNHEHTIARRRFHRPKSGEVTKRGEDRDLRSEPETRQVCMLATTTDEHCARMEVTGDYITEVARHRLMRKDEWGLYQRRIDAGNAQILNIARFSVVVAADDGHRDVVMRFPPPGHQA